MTKILKVLTLILLPLLLVRLSEASPKVTQAAFCDFKANDVTALAVEDFGEPLKLLFVKVDNTVVYSTRFIEGFNNHEFNYTNPFLRFRSYKLKGLPSPIIVAVGVSPGGSDVGYEIKLIGEEKGTITTLTEKPINLTIQDGLYLGKINKKYANGLVVWKHVWGNEIHYAPHRYEIQVFNRNSRSMNFRLVKELVTKGKFKDGCSALRSYRLPCKNFRDEIVPVEQDISTLGIEDKLLPKGEKSE